MAAFPVYYSRHSEASEVTLSMYALICFRYKYDWKIEEAQKNILRTHTTAVSARMLYKLAQQVSYTLWLSSI